MNILDRSIIEIHNALINKETTPLILVKEALKRAKENKDNAFEIILEDSALEEAKKLEGLDCPKDLLMWGIPYVAKDNFSTKDIETTASSNILNGYVPLFDATVIKLLKENGAILIGKATLDELAMGGTGTTGHKGITYNPYDKKHEHLIGGSSCGSAVSVCSGIVPFALGSDTGDSVRKPASNAGLVGLKPTWGLISRFGLFPFAPSLDHVAYFTRNVDDSAAMLNVLAKKDLNDSTCSLKDREENYLSFNSSLNGKKIAVIKEVIDSIDDKDIMYAFNKTVQKMKEKGAIVEYVSIDKKLLQSIYPSYIVISCAEATSNNANLDGIKFGPYYDGKTYQEVMSNARTKGFSPLIKRRFVIGSYSLMSENQEEVFLKAQKIRHLVVNRVNEIFKSYDVIYIPASPSCAPLINGASDKLSSTYLIADNILAIGNFGGYPSITLPLGFKNNLPFGANLTSKPFSEINLFGIAKGIENITGLKDLIAKEER